MRILLDTHLLIWSLDEPVRLPEHVRDAVEAPENEILFSVVSIWEAAIKFALGRSDFPYEPADLVAAALETGFVEAPIKSDAAVRVSSLPQHHRDPFDRLLVAQAMSEGAFLYTSDAQLKPYSDLVRVI